MEQKIFSVDRKKRKGRPTTTWIEKIGKEYVRTYFEYT